MLGGGGLVLHFGILTCLEVRACPPLSLQVTIDDYREEDEDKDPYPPCDVPGMGVGPPVMNKE